MKSIILGILISFPVLGAHASDVKWLLCENGSLVINSVEYRAADGISRKTSLNLIFGMNTLVGELDNTNAGDITFIGTPANKVKFVGSISIDYSTNTLVLNGMFDLFANHFDINSKFNCKKMRDNLYPQFPDRPF